MSRSKHPKLLALILLMVVTGCMRESAVGDQAVNISVKISFEPDPPKVGQGLITLEVEDETGEGIEDLSIQIKGDMTHAGMTPLFGVSTEEGAGKYSIPFEWSMAGDWILQIAADLPAGQVLNRSFEVRVSPE